MNMMRAPLQTFGRMFGRAILAMLVLRGAVESTSFGQTPGPSPLSAAQRKTLDEGADALNRALTGLRARPTADVVDAAIFQKGLQWARQYDTEFTAADVALLQNAITRGTERATRLAAGMQ